MNTENFFVPKILLCGDVAEFLARVNQRPFKIVAQIEFLGKDFNFLKDGRFSIAGKFHNHTELVQILRGGGADYIVFNNLNQYRTLLGAFLTLGIGKAQILTTAQLIALPVDNFYDFEADIQLINYLKPKQIKTLLDFDAHFVQSQILTKGSNDFTKIECIYEKDMLQIKENIYSRVYKKFSDCSLKHYDAVLIDKKTPLDFDGAFFTLKDATDILIIFVRNGDILFNHIRSIFTHFERIEILKSSCGNWFFCYLRKPKEDFANYVVTHKKIPPELVKKFPAGYKIIHAGRALSEDLGYIGDNTGDNISHLNPYINEITALYWLWKNTSDTIVGLSHYRRFFTESNSADFAPEKILTKDAVLKILEDYDIILDMANITVSGFENIVGAVDFENASLAMKIIAKNIEKFQPEYVDAFYSAMNTKIFHICNMFVTRRPVFDAYCNWFFSFFIDSVNEIFRAIPLNNLQGNSKRLMGYFAENILTAYFLKNRLRIKELQVMQVQNI